MEAPQAIHAWFASLGKTGKPVAGEWTVIAGITAENADGSHVAVALGTGTKCLSASQVCADARGWFLHDAHAEVCARRCLLLYVLEQLKLHADGRPDASIFRRVADGGGFELRPRVRLHMYSSRPPCGDAAIFDEAAPDVAGGSAPPDAKRQRVAAAPAQAAEPASSHRTGLTGARPASSAEAAAEGERGGEACAPGLARTKPGRGERTSSMSCSDKLARWAAIGVQGALLSLLLPRPLRLSSLSVGTPCSLPALHRAIVLRAPPPADADADAGGDDGAASLELRAVAAPFEHGDDAAAGAHPCSNSVLWWEGAASAEAVNGLRGTRLGATKGAASPKHRASACKALLLERFRELCAALPAEALPEPLRAVGDVRRRSYRELKLAATDYQRRKADFLGLPAFRDWVHCPPCCEEFS